MVDAARYIRSKWLKSIDIEDDAPIDVTIQKIAIGKYSDDDKEEVLFLHFEEFDKPLGCGNPVLRQLIAMIGRNTDVWPGQRITLTVEAVTAWGEKHQCIRVGDKLPTGKRASKRAVVPDGKTALDNGSGARPAQRRRK